MGYPKFTGFLIALLLVSMFAGIFALFIAGGPNPTGSSDSTYNMSRYNKLTTLSAQTRSIENNTLNVKQQSGVFDLVGGFFSNAFKVITSIPQSMDLFNDMIQSGVSDSNIADPTITLIMTTMELIVVILIIIGIVLSALIKWVL